MKLKLLIIFSFLPLFFSACQKAPINGDLDGQWQVMEVFPAVTGQTDSRFYMCFYMHVCQLSANGPVWTTGNMSFDGDYLSLDFQNPVDEEFDALYKYYGIDSNPITFKVLSLTSKSLVLSSNTTTVTLRKF